MTTSLETSILRTTVMLIGRSNWDQWYLIIEATAKTHQIWDFVKPEATVFEPEEPIEPTAQTINSSKTELGTLDSRETQLYTIMMARYEKEFTKYEQKMKALNGFTVRILESLSQAIVPYVYHCKSPNEMLVKLKQQFATTDKTREKEVLVRYREMCKPPSTKNLEQWLSKWEITHREALELQLPDVQGTRAVDDFVQALRNTDPAFYGYWTNHLENTDIYPSLSDIVDKFRKQQRKEAALNPQHGAFTASFQGEHAKSPRKYTNCVCGQDHHFSECPYLMESQRTAGWTPDPETERRVMEKLENPRLREAVEWARNFVRYRSQSHNVSQHGTPRHNSSQHDTSQHQETPDTDELAGFPASFTTEIASGETEVYPLRDSFILDSGAGVHVCNNPRRLRNLRPAANKFLITGSHREVINGFGEVDIVVQAPNGQWRTTTLKDVALVPTFHTSVVSYKCFEKAGGSWDTRAKTLMYSSKTFCQILDKHGQFVVEYTPLDAPPTENPMCTTSIYTGLMDSTDLAEYRSAFTTSLLLDNQQIDLPAEHPTAHTPTTHPATGLPHKAPKETAQLYRTITPDVDKANIVPSRTRPRAAPPKPAQPARTGGVCQPGG